jgi:hypothetical protein
MKIGHNNLGLFYYCSTVLKIGMIVVTRSEREEIQ